MRPSPAIPICMGTPRCVHLPHKKRRGGIMSAATPKGQVGVIGLGIMGGAIAKNLTAAGWQVIGFDVAEHRSRKAMAAVVEMARDAAAVAAKAANILVSLPKPEALTAIVAALV